MNDKLRNDIDEPIMIRKANDCFADVKQAWMPEMLFDEFWREGELALLFGQSGNGKSILAVQIAEELASGNGIDGFRMPRRGREVLYVDMEMSQAQFGIRNSAVRSHGKLKLHKFSDNFHRDAPKDPDKLIDWLRAAVGETGSRIIVIDSLSAFKKTCDGVRETLKIMRDLKALRDELDLSILVIDECTEQRRGKALTEADLGRSRILCSATDSTFAICRHATHFDMRYIVQTRSKNAAVVWNDSNAPLCSIVKKDTGLLAFQFDDRFVAKVTDDDLELICNIKQARDVNREKYRDIAEIFNISRARAERLYRKWSPAMERKYRSLVATLPVDVDEDLSPQRPGEAESETGSVQETEETINQAGETDGQVKEPEEWEEGGFEKPEWIDIERRDRSSPTPDEPQKLNVAAIPWAAALRRRSIYDLTPGTDHNDHEIWIEEKQEDGRPKVWYYVNKSGLITRWERTFEGNMGTHIGKSPYLERVEELLGKA